jgi:hypothetical protein
MEVSGQPSSGFMPEERATSAHWISQGYVGPIADLDMVIKTKSSEYLFISEFCSELTYSGWTVAYDVTITRVILW